MSLTDYIGGRIREVSLYTTYVVYIESHEKTETESLIQQVHKVHSGLCLHIITHAIL